MPNQPGMLHESARSRFTRCCAEHPSLGPLAAWAAVHQLTNGWVEQCVPGQTLGASWPESPIIACGHGVPRICAFVVM